MAAELVNLATSDKLKEMDWMKNIEICELVARDQGEARDVMKAIKKRLGDKSSNTLLFTVMLLEVLINNCGEHIHRQVIEMGILPTLVKIVKKKSDQPVRKKIFLLLDATQASLGGASGKFPQYHAAYFELVNAGVQFPQTPHVHPSDLPTAMAHKDIPERKPISPKREGVAHISGSQVPPESSIIKKARAALDVLREVLDAIDNQHPEDLKLKTSLNAGIPRSSSPVKPQLTLCWHHDEFTLDLVEQCSFQKQRVMHLVLTCRDEKVVSQAIELNEQLEKLLARHDALISVRPSSSSFHFDHEEAEEEDAHQLSRRVRKGKARVRPEAEEHMEKPLGLFGSIQQERLHRPIIRPVSLEPQESNTELPPPAVVIPPPLHRPIIRPVSSEPPESNTERPPSAVVIPPPPARRVERERFFQEKQVDVLADQMTTSSLSSHKTDSSPS